MDYTLLKQIAKNKGITLKNLALAMSLTPPGFHKLVRENRMPINKLEEAARILNVHLLEFFGAGMQNDGYKDKYLQCLEHCNALQNEIILLKDEKKGGNITKVSSKS